ncbi:MAG: hypothetical protein KJO53_04395 [Eudoraea sp.]|nr:hypothetical protein [Eudoraea sp.]MBT8291987.1 hypothetical protein [Eudoraea sp.]
MKYLKNWISLLPLLLIHDSRTELPEELTHDINESDEGGSTYMITTLLKMNIWKRKVEGFRV